MKYIITILAFCISCSAFAERYLCMCCKDNRQVIEIIIENCEETVKNKYPKLNNLITYTDLLISGTVLASIPYASLTSSEPNKGKKNLEETKKYVYEVRDGTTCKAFKKGSKLLLVTRKVMCGENIEGDLACSNGGDVVTFLPEKFLKLNNEKLVKRSNATE